MANQNNLLNSDLTLFENSLKIVKNELEETFENIMKDVPDRPANLPYKIITPEPGFVLKAYKIIDKDKIFINICQSNAIPPPEDITTDELTKVLKSDTSTFRVPMSITEPRITKDKSHKDATVCDVAIHPDFFKKVERIKLFADFLITIIFEALASKYNIEVDQSNWVTLRNRKVMGTLITHRIQNRDVIKVCESYETPPKGSKGIIEELEKDKPKSINNNDNSKRLIEEIDAENESKTLEYSLVIDESKNIIADFYMPDVKCNEIYLSIDDDSIVLSVPSHGYHLNECLPYTLEPDRANAKFGIHTHILTVTIPTGG